MTQDDARDAGRGLKLPRLKLDDRLHAKQDISSRSQLRDSDNFEIALL